MTLEFHSCAHVEVYYMFCRIPDNFVLLVNVQTFLRYLYTCRVQPYLYGNKSSAYWTWLVLYRDFQSGDYIV